MFDQPLQPAQNAMKPLPDGLLARYPAVTFVLPFAVYLLAGSFESSSAPAGTEGIPPATLPGLPAYGAVYSIKILLTLAAMAFVLPGYRTFAWQLSPLAAWIGVAGGIAWIALSETGIERRLLGALGLGRWFELSARPAFNPFEHFPDSPLWAWGFLAVRFTGLVVVVPIIEEFFLRGFLMRFVSDPHWWKLPLASIGRLGLVAGTAVPALYHPEIVAALVWFSAVTWLMLRTSSIWDCIAAHAITNLILGIYVVAADRWHLV